ncbi:alcohol dehydrogenase catalytic domain-containing protein [Desulfovibrio sp.]|uniref:alcohol dehydrogenase catalytic domain-containing protein n=1 Tax=Desulfovibrio sp. TaxID=885 RepID=UPI003078AAAE
MAETMHALVYHGTNDLRLEERPLPQIQDPRDAIVKVELSSICASDLHIRNGAVPRALPGTVLGHEFVGEVVATGSEVRKVRPGQRVAANVETFCGTCWFCRQGYVNNCRHGGWELGCRIDGCQTEYVRVPFADNGLDPIPDSLSYQDVLLVGTTSSITLRFSAA